MATAPTPSTRPGPGFGSRARPLAPPPFGPPSRTQGKQPARDKRQAKSSTPSLFPVRKPPAAAPTGPAELVGIARLAASSPRSLEKRGTEYFLLPVRSILNHCDSERVPFDWTVNPYRGCEFGCRYCYARYTHEYLELDACEFERKIYVKQDAARLAARDLGERFGFRPACPERSRRVPAEHIAIGTATDPYQPAERDFGVTRSILEQIAAREGLSLSITTKSNQVVRDLDLLARIAARSTLAINITVTTLRPRLARLLEPRAPRPELRLAAVEKLREAGLAVGVFAMPVLPGLTDREADLEALAAAARDAGAQWLAGQVLFLMPASQKAFYPFLEEKFPKLARQYRAWYARSGYAPEAYRRAIAERFSRLRAKYGLGSRSYAPDVAAHPSSQLALALGAPKEPAVGAPVPAPQAPRLILRSRACA